MKYLNCNICDKGFPSQSATFVHKREKHTYYNTKPIECPCCLKLFHSPIFNIQKNKYYDRCEECRELAKLLCAKPLSHGTYVYGINKQRFFIQNGKPIQACSIFNCFNNNDCKEHNTSIIIECTNTKCNNCFVDTESKNCDNCKKISNRKRDKYRLNIKNFKKELGGKCVDCGFNELFYLEFDHINPKDKTIQITRSSNLLWDNEKDKLQLRCGRCHRFKTNEEFDMVTNITNKHIKCKNEKKEFVRKIKQFVGCCQICKWSIPDKIKMCCALDFDHIYGKKLDQISNLYSVNKNKIAIEISKTRLLCRHCHEIYTCLQKGGQSLKFYYTDYEIQNFKNILFDELLMKQCNKEILLILEKLGYNIP